MTLPVTYLGMAVSIAGNLLISISLLLQKYAHIENSKVPESRRAPYYKQPTWVLGLILMVAGEFGNFFAFSLAPVYLVAPLGAVSVVANAVLAAKFLGETMRKRDVVGVAMVVDGATIIVLMAPHSDEKLNIQLLYDYLSAPTFIVYISLLLVVTAVLVVLDKRGYGSQNCVLRICICSLLGSISVMCSKGVSTFLLLTFKGTNMFVYPITYIMIGVAAFTLITQINYLNKSMERFGASEVVPIYYVLFTLSSIVGGVVLYREFYHMGMVRVFGFVGGCILTFSGVYLITSNKEVAEPILDMQTQDTEAAATGDLVSDDTIQATVKTPLIESDGKPAAAVRSGNHALSIRSRHNENLLLLDRARTRLMNWCVLQFLISTLFLIIGIQRVSNPVPTDASDVSSWSHLGEFYIVFGSIGLVVGMVGMYAARHTHSNAARYYLYGMIVLVAAFVIFAFVSAVQFIFSSCPTIEEDTGVSKSEESLGVCQTAKGVVFVPIVLLVGITCPACCCAGCWFSITNLLDRLADHNRLLSRLSLGVHSANTVTQVASIEFAKRERRNTTTSSIGSV